MRLGIRPTIWQPDCEWSKLRKLYGEADEILERHRHRYEVNPDYIERLSGLNFVGKDDKGERMEIVELKDHPYYVGVQFHPEYLSRVLQPSKPFLGFVAASCGYVFFFFFAEVNAYDRLTSVTECWTKSSRNPVRSWLTGFLLPKPSKTCR